MALLGAMVIRLRATRRLTLKNHLGLAVQQRFKEEMKALGVRFGNVAFQPYTVSGVMSPLRGNDPATASLIGTVEKEQSAWVRWTGTSDAVVNALYEWSNHPPATFKLDHIEWAVDDVVWDESAHPWAGASDAARLWDQVHHLPPPAHLNITFATPTTFKSTGNWLPLPHPLLFWGSLDRRWQDLVGEDADLLTALDLPPFIEAVLPLSQFKGESVRVPAKGGKQITGFIGEAGYTVRRDGEALGAFQDLLNGATPTSTDDLKRQLHLLARFGFFAGVGSKPAMGLGMMRLG